MANPLIREFLSDHGDDETVTYDGFDDCIIGVSEGFRTGPVVVYSIPAIIEVLLGEGFSYEEALEHFDFNIRGAWVGERTPIFVHPVSHAPTEEHDDNSPTSVKGPPLQDGDPA